MVLNKFLSRAMAKEDLLRDCRIEDVRWLCSLSESELDLLISLKEMVLRRAKIIGHDSLAKKFDLKMLRALGFILMEHLKGQLKDVSVIPGLAESSSFLDGCNILNSKLSDTFSSMDIEELRAYVGTDQRKRLAEIFGKDEAHDQKKKSHV
ncbi:uncharacterized protein LOC131325649 isoform X1 [Rhododendron vialii]|uniref:uncharacterized protein LOC131325649 isoform X1 n=2 Tax=Rhododendron vialii TaxID=182163 RepID=UPI00265D661B|nr:uncharacterized protein LOC131325649 isoform X1 [Rhododendron vialii]